MPALPLRTLAQQFLKAPHEFGLQKYIYQGRVMYKPVEHQNETSRMNYQSILFAANTIAKRRQDFGKIEQNGLTNMARILRSRMRDVLEKDPAKKLDDVKLADLMSVPNPEPVKMRHRFSR